MIVDSLLSDNAGSGTSPRRWIVSQIGSREHYAAARALLRVGRLVRLYTDVWCGDALKTLLPERMPAARALAGRSDPEIPEEKVVHFMARTLLGRLRQRLGGASNVWEMHARIGQNFALNVNRHLERQAHLIGDGCAFFGYCTGSLETLRLVRRRGGIGVVDQIDPGHVEDELVVEESQRWPAWEQNVGIRPRVYFDRLEAEWGEADRVVVNSQWALSALVKQGVPPAKIAVVPLGFEPPVPSFAGNPLPNTAGPLRVLWLGTVCLRKGIPYLFEAARQLLGSSIQFTVAGPVQLTPYGLAQAPANVKLAGRITRDQAVAYYRQADVFVLPTVSDGFAITQLEAMAAGLPVITTPNCGEVVSDGEDGLIVPARDAAALAEAIRRLDTDRALLRTMSEHAVRKSRLFRLDRYAAGILAAGQSSGNV